MLDEKFLEKFIEKIGAEGELSDKFYSSLRGGKNNVYYNVTSEAVTLDEGWIQTLESALFSVEKIVRNPRKFIAEEELIVDVDRARRTNAKTVRHLSSNSQYVQSITADGEVRPKKVLTTEMQEDIAIYENRFVCALVNRLVPFVEGRYRDISHQVNTEDTSTVGISSNFDFGGSKLECNIQVKVKEPPHDKVLLEKNASLLERIMGLRRRILVLQNTEFIQKLSAGKQVHAPIMKTNLIKMNVDYQNCYKLWLYISSYSFVGYSVQFQERTLPIGGDYYDDLTVLCALSVKSLISNNIINAEEYNAIPYKAVKEKKYKQTTSLKFEPKFVDDKKQAGEDVINEYYFTKMRDELVKATFSGGKTDEKVLSLSFARFFRSISKINGEMYADVIKSQQQKSDDIVHKTPVQKKEDAVKAQELVLKRYRLLSRLKREELEKALNAESRELIKLEKLKSELEVSQGREKTAKERAKKSRERAKKIKEKKSIAESNAKKYEAELREKDAEKAQLLADKKREKREEAKRRRELKRLEELKEKYDGQDI
jgi:hypothetical protein